jgi:hypothetical protein
MLCQWLYTIPSLMLGGYVAAWLAPRRELAHPVAMAIVQDLLIVVLIFEVTHYGGADPLRVVEQECPEPKDGEVRVRVLSTAADAER